MMRRNPGDKPATPELNAKPDEDDNDTLAGADAELHTKPDEESNDNYGFQTVKRHQPSEACS